VVGGTDIELGVIGPMARTAGDLALALSVLAGPTGDYAKAWRLDLPSPRGCRISDFRVLILDNHPLAAVSREIVGILHGLADRLADAGAKVERRSPRLPDLAAAHGQYLAMLQVLMTLGRPQPEGAPPPMSAEAWIMGLNMREAVRRSWAALFEDFDVVLAPPFGTTAFPHDDSPPEGRTLTIDGAQVPYFSQLAWSSIATFPGLPSTCVPVGRSAEGLPVGVQIIGPYWEDQTTIAFAGFIEQAG
jgi:amidase